MSQLISDIHASGGLITAVVGGNNITVNTVAGVATVNVSGTTQYAVQVGNALGALTSLGIGTAGQVLTSNGPGMNPSFQSNGISSLLFDGNTGTASPSADTIIFNTAHSTVIFAASGHTLLVDFAASTNLGLGSAFPSVTGSSNVGVGKNALNSVTTGGSNIAVGVSSLTANTQGFFNTAVGGLSLASATTSSFNTAIGYNSLNDLTTTDSNTAVGAGTLSSLLTGVQNIAIGLDAGSALTSSESSNIYLGNVGVISESNVIRIGTDGSGAGQQNTTVIAGDVASVRSFTADLGDITAADGNVVITEGNLEFGTATVAGGGKGLISFGGSGNSFRWISGYGTQNFFAGFQSGNTSLTTASAVGNTGVGFQVLQALTTGAANTVLGESAGTAITTGTHNTAVGLDALESLTTGTDNVIIGDSSGTAYTTSESNNIILGANITGTIAESDIIRIGNSSNTQAYITGIYGNSPASYQTVIVNSSGQLGSTSSASPTLTVPYTAVNHAASPYTALSTDYYLGVNVSAGVVTIELPNSPATGRVFIVKDNAGDAATNNITVTTVGGSDLIDGFTTFTINNNYQAAQFIWNSSAWEIF